MKATRSIVYSIIPQWSKPIMRVINKEARFTFYRIRRRLHYPVFPQNTGGSVCVHLGCGEVNLPGFINFDVRPFPHVHYVQGVEDLSVLPNNYADLLYACHVLEHISHCKVLDALVEWHRVLKDGGTLRLTVPDFDKLVEVYLIEGKDIQAIVQPLMGGQDYIYNFHKSVFNEKYLGELLLLAGFRKVRGWEPQEVGFPSLADWSSKPIMVNGKEYFISLNLEAIR